jgi:hypothetical protein
MTTPTLLRITPDHFNSTDGYLITVLYKLDKETVRFSKWKGITSFIDEIEAIAFLDKL